MKTLIIFFCLIGSLFSTASNAAYRDKTFLVGSVQFPKQFKQWKIYVSYSCGKKINTEVDQEGKRVSFSLSQNRGHSLFYLLVIDCRAIGFEKTENNTIKHFKALPDWPYKFYVLELIDTYEKNKKNHRGE